jgi:hypothetical protein
MLLIYISFYENIKLINDDIINFYVWLGEGFYSKQGQKGQR